MLVETSRIPLINPTRNRRGGRQVDRSPPSAARSLAASEDFLDQALDRADERGIRSARRVVLGFLEEVVYVVLRSQVRGVTPE
jgi:hypothetical protein